MMVQGFLIIVVGPTFLGSIPGGFCEAGLLMLQPWTTSTDSLPVVALYASPSISSSGGPLDMVAAEAAKDRLLAVIPSAQSISISTASSDVGLP